MSELKETSAEELGSCAPDEDGRESISSEESATNNGWDLADRVRGKTCSAEIWNTEEILESLNRLPGATELSNTLPSNIETLLGSTRDSALLWASWLGRASLLSKLVKADDVAVNITDDGGRTSLHLAAMVGNEECVSLLLENGADPNQWDHKMTATPLHCAANSGNLNCLKLLISHGADVNAGLTLTNTRTPLHFAVLSNSPDCVEELLKNGASPDTPQVFTETPLHIAADLGSAKCVQLLLDAGADVRSQLGPNRYTALHLAAEDGHAECTRLLIDRGATIDAINIRKQTPLHLAALAQASEAVQLLVTHGAAVGARDADGRTPLHAAIANGSSCCEVTRILLEAGANPNRADYFGYTPMHIAALNEFSSIVCLLLDFGGDVTLRTNGGVSVLSFVIRRTPDVLPTYIKKFDDAIRVSEHDLGDADCELKLDFRVLVPCLARGEAELMLAFIEVGRKDILKHPLCETFLFLKWRRIRKYFIGSLIYHALFIFLFSVYVLGVYVCMAPVCKVKHDYLKVLGVVIMILNVLFLAKELFQVRNNLSTYYIQWENWLQCLIVIGVALSILPNGAGMLREHTYMWQHDTAAVTVFLCWVELMIIVGRFPMFGLYVQMFTTVTVNFATFLLAYSCLLIAFAMSFRILFANYKGFKHIITSLIKTVVMMSGELEYEDTFYREIERNNTKDLMTGAGMLGFMKSNQYPITAHILFLLFVILVTVILTNLLVGLAVSDIQALRESAGLDRLVRRAQLVAHLESMLFSRLLTWVPTTLLTALRRGALLTTSTYRSALQIRPNDPREKRIPRHLITSLFKLVTGRKDLHHSARESSNYELKIDRDSDKRKKETYRRSYLFDSYSKDKVERRKRTSSIHVDDRKHFSYTSTMQDMCMADIRSQLVDINKKIDALAGNYESKRISSRRTVVKSDSIA